MKKMLNRVTMFLCLGLLLLPSGNVSASAARPEGERASEKMPAPNFSLETINGKTVSLKDSRGKGVILFFYATWCPYCRQKLPVLSKDYGQYQSQNIDLLAIDAGESKAKVSSFAAKEKLPFDVLLDSKMKTSEAYDVVGVPTFVLISKDGFVVYEGNDLPHNYKELLAK